MKAETITKYKGSVTFVLLVFCFLLQASPKEEALKNNASHPRLVINANEIAKMREGVLHNRLFAAAFKALKKNTDKEMKEPVLVPRPLDPGGGFSHERHKFNYHFMYDSALLYQLTGNSHYAKKVVEYLLEYAKMYPTLPIHPFAKSDNKGKLFWQGLNEAVWLVHVIQAYDLVYDQVSTSERKIIEESLLRPAANFLSAGSPHTFDRIHNHATWSVAAVGMTGYVLDDQNLVDIALKGLDKSGRSGFLKQIAMLFSPQGYYTEGPYYQRYALMPFVTFAKAINNNQPKLKIFEYGNKKILKAIDTMIQLSYRKYLFPINDAIKDKTIESPEIVSAVAVAYGFDRDGKWLDVARLQNEIVVSGDGLLIAQGLIANKLKKFPFHSVVLNDGSDGKDGAIVVLREPSDTLNTNNKPANREPESEKSALVFKATGQGMGHGHFDRLNWIFYDQGSEIISDYGASRYLNLESKSGGRYLETNESWAKQTVAHNTLVVDEKSQFGSDAESAQKYPSRILDTFFSDRLQGTTGEDDKAYQGLAQSRSLVLFTPQQDDSRYIIDLLRIKSKQKHRYDLPVHYNGHIIDSNINIDWVTSKLQPLSTNNGYQHLWIEGLSSTRKGVSQVTFQNKNGRFYTNSSVIYAADENNAKLLPIDTKIYFTQLGANDPNHDLRTQHSIIQRLEATSDAVFVNILEIHGEYNTQLEYTHSAKPTIKSVVFKVNNNVDLIQFDKQNGKRYLLAIRRNSGNQSDEQSASTNFRFMGKIFEMNKTYQIFDISSLQHD